ncbi:DUF1801 domain-containing protein [Algoriphagus sp.]|uniref:YdeI/OmpD-associated family protein n=1 Tax=Algoriphagus sp. TaxID=1872435 RepID=UPI0025FAAFF4|nr:DUF1801 domain-containing protein [Algoriphagus sp.]
MNTSVDNYFIDGCGRCSLGGTPQCKVHSWTEELYQLRKLLRQSELVEESKWGMPCYTFNGTNIILLSAFKNYCTINFFNGALLKDPHKILSKPGENTQVSRVVRFMNVEEIVKLEKVLESYFKEAIEIEKAGLKAEVKKNTKVDFVIELQQKLEDDPGFKSAFEALTPGRQRGYNIYFSQAKQTTTRVSRIEKSAAKIFEGKGWNER